MNKLLAKAFCDENPGFGIMAPDLISSQVNNKKHTLVEFRLFLSERKSVTNKTKMNAETNKRAAGQFFVWI